MIYLLLMITTNNTQTEAKFFKGLGDKSRLSILETVMDEPKTVGDIVTQTGLSQPNVSMHLSCLLDCGLVQRTKNGREVIYSVSCCEVSSLISTMRHITQKYAAELRECKRY